MIDYKTYPQSKTAEFLIGGKITSEEYNRVIKNFKKDLKKWDEINVLELVENIDGMDPMVLIKDLKFAINEFGTINKKMKKCAVVAEQKWIKWMTQTFVPFVDGEIRFYKPNEEEIAREWVGVMKH